MHGFADLCRVVKHLGGSVKVSYRRYYSRNSSSRKAGVLHQVTHETLHPVGKREGRLFNTAKRNGGETIINVKLPNEGIKSYVAVCSKQDVFNRRIGRDIAAGRALKDLGIHLPTR